MKNLLMFLLAFHACKAVGQIRLKTQTLYPETTLKVKGCPKKIAVHYDKKRIFQCKKFYSFLELRNEQNKPIFKILFRQELDKVYCFPINDLSKIKETDCYESIIINFSDSLQSKRFGGETERDEFPMILIKKEIDKNNTKVFTYRIGYLPPSSSPYMDSIVLSEKLDVLGVNYIVPGYEPGNEKNYGLLEFKLHN